MKHQTDLHINTVGRRADPSAMERRKHPRLNAISMEADISDKIGFSTGTIKDISRFGICITDIPRKLQSKNNSITVIISSKGKRFKLLLKPQWEKQEGLTLVAGASFDNAPWDWTAMIIKLEPQDNDIWGNH